MICEMKYCLTRTINVRLAVVLLTATLIAGCGGGSDDSAGRDEGTPNRQSAVEPMSDPSRESQTAESDDLVKTVAVAPPGGLSAEEEPAVKTVGEVEAPFRKWFDSAGNLVAVGEFIAVQGDKVCLQKQSGEGIVLPIDGLSEADRQFVDTQMTGDVSEPADEPEEEEAPPSGELLASHPSGPVENAAGAPPRASQADDASGGQKVVIPFDFVSKFDDGDYGRRVAEGIWTKLSKEGGFIIPDSMYDVRLLCEANHVQIGPDTPLDRVEKVVKDYFDAHIGIWGSVERVPGHEWDVYDLVIKCVDFSGPEPEVVYECSARTKVVSEIPHLYRKQMLDKLYQRQPTGPEPVDLLAEENWKNNPNLVAGDFEKGTGGVPTGWASVGGQQREPLGRLVSWVAESGNPDNKVIRFTFDKGVGNSTGVMYYSDYFPVEEGATYRFQCRYRTNGPSPKVFIKCSDEMVSKYGETSDVRFPGAGPGGDEGLPERDQRREVYRSQQNLKGPKNVWNTQTEDFTPKHTKYTPRWGRVMLYAYLGGGVVEWDDVVVKQILPAKPPETEKAPRHSMESTVTIEEMRENERRGQEVRERLRRDRKD